MVSEVVSGAALIENVSDEMLQVEPEVVHGANIQIEFPFRDNVRLSNFVRFHHPDGTTSDIAAPTFNPQRPTPYRRRFLQHWLAKRGPNGGRWFFLTRQVEAPELPIRCFVAPGGRQCTKRVPSIPDLFMHVTGKHGEESKLYADVLESMKKKMQAQLDPETIKALGLGGATAGEAPKTASEASYCRLDGCPRFFDSEGGRNQHEYVCPHKKKESE